MLYKVVLKPSAGKAFDALPKHVQAAVAKKVDQLKADGSPHGSKKLKGFKGLRRIRVGDYRIVYTDPDGAGVIRILAIGNRGGIYRHV